MLLQHHDLTAGLGQGVRNGETHDASANHNGLNVGGHDALSELSGGWARSRAAIIALKIQYCATKASILLPPATKVINQAQAWKLMLRATMTLAKPNSNIRPAQA